MPESQPPIELRGLDLKELQALIDARQLPPVDKWNPERCGHSRMRIARDGTWHHEGKPIRPDARAVGSLAKPHRARRHLASRGQADSPGRDGATFLDSAAPRAGRASFAR